MKCILFFLRALFSLAVFPVLFLYSTGCRKFKGDIIQKSFTKGNVSWVTPKQRFKDSIFNRSDIDIVTNAPFKSVADYAPLDAQKVALSLDYYEPRKSLDTMPLRPLIIWMHGGGFEIGQKEGERETCMRLAIRGYTVASIDYRLNPTLTPKRENNTVTVRDIFLSVYRAIQDARFAIRFSKFHALSQRIDSNKVFFAGLSAGAVTALHVAYLDDSEIAPSALDQATRDSLGGLDYGGPSLLATAKVNGILVFSGSILDINVIKPGDNNIPAISLHSAKDSELPIGCGDSVYHLITSLCSGREVHFRLDMLGVRNAFKLYDEGQTPVPFLVNATHGGVVTPGGSNYLTEDGLQFAVDSLSAFFNLH